jgi:hypothetical protein
MTSTRCRPRSGASASSSRSSSTTPPGSSWPATGGSIAAFGRAGLELYNEAILTTAIGSLPVRAGRTFAAGRKLGKTHQNVLVFVKGDAKRATEACGPVEVYVPEELSSEATPYGERLEAEP